MFKLKPKNNIISVLDVGSSSTICVIAKSKSNGDFDIIGVGHKRSSGIRAGVISNLNEIAKSINLAVEDAERLSGERIEQAYICISGCGMSSKHIAVDISVDKNYEISERDIKALDTICMERFKSHISDDVIIDVIPIDYTLDRTSGIENPLGMFATMLSATYHLVSVKKYVFNNFLNCINRTKLQIAGYVPISLSAGFAVLSKDEMKHGAILLDIGSCSSTISIFKNNHLLYNASVDIGGFYITRDISCAFSVSLDCAERIKILYGSALYNGANKEEVVSISNNADESSEDSLYYNQLITRGEISAVISPRVHEILEIMMKKLKESEIYSESFFESISKRVVLTGGSSMLTGVAHVAELVFESKNIRIGFALSDKVTHNNQVDLKDLSFVSAVGAIKLISNHFFKDSNASEFNNPGVVKRILHWIKDKVDL